MPHPLRSKEWVKSASFKDHQDEITSVRARVYSCRPAQQKNNSLLPQARREAQRSDKLPNHPGGKKIVHPVLFVAFLAQMRRELGPVPDTVQQRMNKDLAPAGGEFAG
jgi:hypothetical protein